MNVIIYMNNGIEIAIVREGDPTPQVAFTNWYAGRGESYEAAVADARDARDWQAALVQDKVEEYFTSPAGAYPAQRSEMNPGRPKWTHPQSDVWHKRVKEVDLQASRCYSYLVHREVWVWGVFVADSNDIIADSDAEAPDGYETATEARQAAMRWLKAHPQTEFDAGLWETAFEKSEA